MFTRPPDDTGPAAIAAELIRTHPDQLGHLEEARIGWLLRHDVQFKAGKRILGTCYLPSVQGSLRPVFDWFLAREFGGEPPLDFLVVLDDEYWTREATPRQRQILVHHELMHMDHAHDKHGAPRYDRETGQPVFAIRGHDIEEFVAIVAEYGAHRDEIRAFLAAAGQHEIRTGQE